MPQILEKLRLPLGSVVVDGAMILTLAFVAGQTMNRFEAMDARLTAIEHSESIEKLPQRMAVQERSVAALDGEVDQMRIEIIRRLERIEDLVRTGNK